MKSFEINEIRKKISGEEYDFLRTNKDLKNNIILLTLGGSISYGTNRMSAEYTSDIDLRGIKCHSKREIYTMKYNEKPYENRELDVVIYPLKKMIALLTNCNPNTIELLGTKDEHLLYCSKEGKLLRDNRYLFLTQQAYRTFGNYAIAQLRRLQNALARGCYPQSEKEEHILKVINSKLFEFENKYNDINSNSFKLFIDKSNKDSFNKEIFMNINLEKFPLRDFVGMYSELNNIVQSFDKLNHRNSKKDELHLLKHAMHLIRLLITGTDILKGKGINTYREKERVFFLDILNKKYSYDELFQMVDEYEAKFEYAYKHTSLPIYPDMNKIDDLTMELNKQILLR